VLPSFYVKVYITESLSMETACPHWSSLEQGEVTSYDHHGPGQIEQGQAVVTDSGGKLLAKSRLESALKSSSTQSFF